MRSSCLATAIVLLFLQPAQGQLLRQPALSENPAAAAQSDTTASEQRIEEFSRRYRISVYNAFHANRPQYDAHRAALEKALQAWRAAGSRQEHLERLLTWLQQASDSLRSRPPGPLPGIPEFVETISPKPLAPRKPPEKPPVPTDKEPPARLPVPPIVQPTPPRPVEKPVQPKPIEQPTPPTPVEEPVQPKPVEQPVPVKPIEPEEPKEPAQTPRPIAPPPVAPKIEDTAKPAPAPVMPKLPTTIPPTSPATEKEPSLPARPDIPKATVSPPPPYVIELPTLPDNVGSTQKPPPVVAEPRKPISPKPAPYARKTPAATPILPGEHPSAGKSGQGQIARTRQMPALPGLSTGDLAGLGKARPATPGIQASDEDSNAEINLIELAAQIAGTNMALRGLEAQLSKSRHWDTMQLEQVVGVLKQLSARRKDLTLFRDLLPESDRRLVGQLDPMRPAISECRARIAEAKSRAASKSFRGSEEDRKAELKKLDVLSRELAKLVTDI